MTQDPVITFIGSVMDELPWIVAYDQLKMDEHGVSIRFISHDRNVHGQKLGIESYFSWYWVTGLTRDSLGLALSVVCKQLSDHRNEAINAQ